MGLFKKKTELERIREYFNKGFKREIRDFENVRQRLEGYRKEYKKSRDLDWKTAFDAAAETIDGNEHEALLFMETYDFLRRPETDVVRNLAESSKEAIEALEKYQSGGAPIKGAEGILAYQKSFARTAGEITDAEMREELAKIDGLLSSLSERAKENQHHDGFRKLETYYLPTMEKLLRTFLDVEKKQGSNIDTIKNETKEGAETLITVLNSLYNDSFVDTALDISAESSVMRKVAARDGLMENTDFVQAAKQEDIPQQTTPELTL